MALMIIGLGGNVGSEAELRARFGEARRLLGELGPVVKSSRLYRTAPIGPAQADFLNAAVGLQWNPPHEQIVPALQAIERQLGRDRASEVRFGPRPLDLDVLQWNGYRIAQPGLVVPHPRLEERVFAIQTVLDIAYDRDLAETGGALGYQRCDEIAASW